MSLIKEILKISEFSISRKVYLLQNDRVSLAKKIHSPDLLHNI